MSSTLTAANLAATLTAGTMTLERPHHAPAMGRPSAEPHPRPALDIDTQRCSVPSQAEMDARRHSISASAHESIIEGARPDPATNYIFEAYIRGQIRATDLIPWLDKHYGMARQPE